MHYKCKDRYVYIKLYTSTINSYALSKKAIRFNVKKAKVNAKLRSKLRNRSFFIAEGSMEKRRGEGIIDFRCVSIRAGALRKARREGHMTGTSARDRGGDG